MREGSAYSARGRGRGAPWRSRYGGDEEGGGDEWGGVVRGGGDEREEGAAPRDLSSFRGFGWFK